MSNKYLQSTAQHLLNGLGSELNWGWSPAVDMISLQAERRKGQMPPADSDAVGPASSVEPKSAPEMTKHDSLDDLLAEVKGTSGATTATDTGSSSLEPVNFLLAGAADLRHVLRTMSKLHRREGAEAQRPVHFYVYEPNLRVHCRHLLFFHLLFDSLTLNELEDRIALFLELYGNVLLRDQTHTDMRAMTQKVLRLLGHEDGPLASMLSFDHMKSSERDFIEDQMKNWVKDSTRFPVVEQWSRRVQSEMAERYDNRDNIIDWDFHFKLTEYTSMIKFPEYREWRNTGQGYDYCRVNPRKGFTYDYTTPNKSLAHFDKKGNGTYFGDVKVGPFFAFGVETESEYLTKRGVDGTMRYGNGVVAMHNMRAWLYELLTGQEWQFTDHQFAWDDPKYYNPLPPDTPSDVMLTPGLPPVKLHFVGVDLDRLFLRLKERPNPVRFDGAFVGTNCTQFMTPSFFAAMKPDGFVVAETLKYVTDAMEDAKMAFVEKISRFGAGAAPAWSIDPKCISFLHQNHPPPRKFDVELTKAQEESLQKYQYPFQIVLSRGGDAALTEAMTRMAVVEESIEAEQK